MKGVRHLIWLSDACFQLAGAIGLLALITGLSRRSRAVEATGTLAGVSAGLAASGLLGALLARRIYLRARGESSAN